MIIILTIEYTVTKTEGGKYANSTSYSYINMGMQQRRQALFTDYRCRDDTLNSQGEYYLVFKKQMYTYNWDLHQQVLVHRKTDYTYSKHTLHRAELDEPYVKKSKVSIQKL